MTVARLARWAVRVLLGGVVLVAAAIIAVWVALGTDAGQTAIRSRLETLLVDATGARVSIGHLGGTLVYGVTARDVRITFPGGTRFAVDELRGSYLLTKLLGPGIEFGTVSLHGVRARIVHTADGWGLVEPGASEAETAAAVPTILFPRVRVEDGRVALELRDAVPPRRYVLAGVSLEGSLSISDSKQEVGLETLHAVPRGIDVSPLWGNGTITISTEQGIDLDKVTLATRRSRVFADGTLVQDRRATVRLDLDPLSARELRALIPAVGLAADVAGSVTARGPWRRLAVRAGLRTPASGRVRLFGTLDAGAPDLAYRAVAQVGHLNLQGIDGTLPASDLSGRVAGAGALTTLETPLDVRLAVRGSTVAGTRVDAARLAGHVRSDGLDAWGHVRAPGGAAAIDGRLGWSGELTTYHARARADVTDLAALVPQARGTARVRLDADGRGFEGPARTAKLGVRLDGGKVADVPLDRGRAQIALDGDLVKIVTARLDALGVRGDGSGTVDLRRESVDATMTAAGNVAPAAGWLGGHGDGAVTARATARGTLRDLAVEGSGSVEHLRSGDITAERTSLALSLGGLGGVTPAGRGTLDVAGLRRKEATPWTGTVAADWRRQVGVDTVALTAKGSTDTGDQLATRSTIRRTSAGETTADVQELTLATEESGAWQLSRPATLRIAGNAVAVDRLELTSGAQRVAVAGRAGSTGPADATLEWHGIDLATACRLSRAPKCQGRADGNARLTGTAADPRLSLAVNADRVVVEHAPPISISATGDYAARAFSLRGAVTEADAGRLDVQGTLPVDLAWEGPRRDLSDAPVQLAVRSDGLDLATLRLLLPGTVRDSGGRLVADLRLEGAWSSLRADGRVEIRDGRLGLATTGVTYQGIELVAVAGGQAIEVQTLRARGGSGTLDGSGQLALSFNPSSPLALRLRFEHFQAVSQTAYEAATDGVLTVEGSLSYPVVRGDLTLTHLLIRPATLSSTSGPSLQVDPTIEVVGLDTPPVEPPAPTPDVADVLSLAVSVQIVRDAWIRRNDADVELRGHLRFDKAAHQPLFITGDIRLVRGWYVFQGRRFTLQEGRITFGGDVPPDPLLDITALYKTGEYEVTIQVSGRASQPTLALSSLPPLEQADILSVLVFGRPARDLGHNESVDLQRQALSLASGYVMPELRQSVMNTLGLDTFEVGDEGVRAGRYVTHDVFVTLAQDFTGRAGQVMGVEYSVTRWLSLKLSTSTRGDSAVDLLWHRRY